MPRMLLQGWEPKQSLVDAVMESAKTVRIDFEGGVSRRDVLLLAELVCRYGSVHKVLVGPQEVLKEFDASCFGVIETGVVVTQFGTLIFVESPRVAANTAIVVDLMHSVADHEAAFAVCLNVVRPS